MISATSTLQAFACDHCGQCCERLIFTPQAHDGLLQAGTFGMMLAPGEQRDLLKELKLPYLWRHKEKP